jgi:hypothetical protein
MDLLIIENFIIERENNWLHFFLMIIE